MPQSHQPSPPILCIVYECNIGTANAAQHQPQTPPSSPKMCEGHVNLHTFGCLIKEPIKYANSCSRKIYRTFSRSFWPSLFQIWYLRARKQTKLCHNTFQDAVDKHSCGTMKLPDECQNAARTKPTQPNSNTNNNSSQHTRAKTYSKSTMPTKK